MRLSILFLIASHLILPIVFFISGSNKQKDKITSLCWMLMTSAWTAYMFATGRWDWLGYYLRYALLAGLLMAIVRAYRNNRQAPLWPGPSWTSWGRIVIPGVLTVAFLFMAVISIGGRGYSGEAVALHFPLKDGTYYVAHGGSIPVINYHNDYLPQQFALDISKLNGWGSRAAGLLPDDLHRYAIYGDRLYSPCSGVVRKAVDGFPDRLPSDFANGLPEGTPAAGNHVVIGCHDTDVYIAHIQQGSVQVQEGDAVEAGSWIGNVGNSGNTTEPHLHLHAEKDGVGVPIVFEGRFLIRNSLFRSME